MRQAVIPLLLVVLALALRVAGIGSQELWLDEAESWRIAASPDVVGSVLPNNTPPLYYLLLHAWIGVFGDGRTALRLLSAVEGTLFVAAVMLWARTLFTRRVALWTGLWAAVAPMEIYYSQEARAYAQLTLLLAVTYTCVGNAAARNQRRWWLGAVGAATAALYTHYLAAFGLVCAAALIVVRPPTPWRRAGVAAAAVVLAFLPWVAAALGARPSTGNGLQWIAEVWDNTPPSMAVFRSLEILVLGGHAGLSQVTRKQLAVIEFAQPLHLLGLIGLLGLAVVALSRYGDAATASGSARPKWAVLSLLVGPLLLLWSVSWLQPLYVVGRYDQVAVPAYLVLLGLACAKLHAGRGALVAACAAAVVLLPIGWKLRLYYAAAPSDLQRRAAAVLDAKSQDGDVVVFTELRALPVIYEMTRLGYVFSDKHCTGVARRRRLACRAYPRTSESLMAIMTERDPSKAAAEIAADAADFADDRVNDANSVWIVLGRYRVAPGKVAASPTSAALLDELERRGLRSVSAEPTLGILEYRALPG